MHSWHYQSICSTVNFSKYIWNWEGLPSPFLKPLKVSHPLANCCSRHWNLEWKGNIVFCLIFYPLFGLKFVTWNYFVTTFINLSPQHTQSRPHIQTHAHTHILNKIYCNILKGTILNKIISWPVYYPFFFGFWYNIDKNVKLNTCIVWKP